LQISLFFDVEALHVLVIGHPLSHTNALISKQSFNRSRTVM